MPPFKKIYVTGPTMLESDVRISLEKSKNGKVTGSHEIRYQHNL